MRYHYRVGVMVPFVQKYYKQLVLVVAAAFMATMAMMSLNVNAQPQEVDVYGNTVDELLGETVEQSGWWFNRDTSTDTPYMFVNNKKSLGDGSIYVPPISSNPSDKFIAENFVQMPVEELESISYDFLIAGNGTPADASDFYLNVYVNIDRSGNYYDCRFDYVPSTGSTSNFTTASFNATDTPSDVRLRGTRTPACPATLAEMPAGSYVRMYSVTLGQSTVSDQGLAGYFDKVVVNTVNDDTTYDFERLLNTGEITAPVTGAVLSGDVTLEATYEDNTDGDTDGVMWAVRSDAACGSASKTVLGNVNGKTDVASWDSSDFSFTFDSTSLTDGQYCFTFNPSDDSGENDVRVTRVFEIDNTRPVVQILDPTAEEEVSGVVDVIANVSDDNQERHRIIVRDESLALVYASSWVMDDDDLTAESAGTWDSTSVNDGRYRITVRAEDEAGNVRTRSVWVVTENYLSDKDECKDGGWTLGALFDDQDREFRNQGDCVSHFASEKQRTDNPDGQAVAPATTNARRR